MKEGDLRFVVLLNDNHYQRGYAITFVQLAKYDSGYASSLDGKFRTNDLTFTLGWMQQGGDNGIDSRYAVFQLEELVTDPTIETQVPSAERLPPYRSRRDNVSSEGNDQIQLC